MKIKALFLLSIFLLNTGIGLNCALRGCCDDCRDKIAEHHQYPVTSIEKDEPCCQGAVNSFASLAKLIPQSPKVFIPVAVYIRPYGKYILKYLPNVKSVHLLSVDERQRPPTPDVRISIQSFQI